MSSDVDAYPLFIFQEANVSPDQAPEVWTNGHDKSARCHVLSDLIFCYKNLQSNKQID